MLSFNFLCINQDRRCIGYSAPCPIRLKDSRVCIHWNTKIGKMDSLPTLFIPISLKTRVKGYTMLLKYLNSNCLILALISGCSQLDGRNSEATNQSPTGSSNQAILE